MGQRKSRYVSAKTLSGYMDMNERTFARMAADGKFPSPVKIGHKIIRWDMAKVAPFMNKTRTLKEVESMSVRELEDEWSVISGDQPEIRALVAE